MVQRVKAQRTARRQARGAAPRTASEAVSLARRLIESGEERRHLEQALKVCERALREEAADALRHDLLVLSGIALSQLARCREALERLEEAAGIFPDSLEVALERAVALFELCRFEEAEPLFAQVARSDPDEAWAHHYLGLLSERRGEKAAAGRHFARAARAAPGEVPAPLALSDAAFERAVEQAVARLPERLTAFCAGVPLEVEAVPALEDLLAVTPPLSPSILGVFRGPPLGVRGERSIALFRHNLERSARSEEELVEQISVTLLHEIGHLVGLTEPELWRRGLE